ncbi:MAG: ABC transporter permease [Imperialibacter sp.]|uniref:ABC transporter permease n=1 Tax=Imperialibacter sp. TaxID=2038411 RepID=UPI003A865500
MTTSLRAIAPEFLKLRHSTIVWVTFVAFALGPVMGGLSLYLLGHAGDMGDSPLSEKAKLMNFSADWPSYVGLLTQVVGVGGVVVFGFVASWLFGREYSDKTAKDLLALPASRSSIINAKFVVYAMWCLALVVANLLLGLVVGALLGLDNFDIRVITSGLNTYFATTILVMLLGTPVSFMGIWGKGYLAPIGLVVLMLIVSQIVGAVGLGQYFPWSVPGLYSGISAEMKATLTSTSFGIVGFVAIFGYFATHWWWNKTDQT